MPHILLFEENQGRIPHLVFLMKLAEVDCTVARTAEELLNWLSADRLMIINFDLVLLNSLPRNGMDNLLLTELSKVATVPVICVKRLNKPLSISMVHNVVTCHPDDILDCVNQQLSLVDT